MTLEGLELVFFPETLSMEESSSCLLVDFLGSWSILQSNLEVVLVGQVH
jgi:hypothetical protein